MGGAASVHTAVSATYSGRARVHLRPAGRQFAALAAGTLYTATVVIPAAKEYQAAAAANDTTGRALLPYGPQDQLVGRVQRPGTGR